MIEVYRITRTADKLSCYSSIPPVLELAEHSLKIDQFKADKRKRFFYAVGCYFSEVEREARWTVLVDHLPCPAP